MSIMTLLPGSPKRCVTSQDRPKGDVLVQKVLKVSAQILNTLPALFRRLTISIGSRLHCLGSIAFFSTK